LGREFRHALLLKKICVALPVEEHGRRLDRAFSRSVLERASDDRLVALTREGYDAAFEAIVRRYRTPLVRYGTTFLDAERAQDVVQQSLLKALTALRGDGRPMQLKPWLYRIVHNEALNVSRRQELATEQLDEEFDGVPQPPDVLARSERLHEVVAGISELPSRQRSAVLLREFEGRSYDDIATRMGTTTPVVRALLHRARTRLRDTCGALIPLQLIRTWLEALTSPTGAGAMKLGTAAVVSGVIAGGAAVGVQSQNHNRDRTPVADRTAPAVPAPRAAASARFSPRLRSAPATPIPGYVHKASPARPKALQMAATPIPLEPTVKRPQKRPGGASRPSDNGPSRSSDQPEDVISTSTGAPDQPTIPSPNSDGGPGGDGADSSGSGSGSPDGSGAGVDGSP
jgi:RNA polymerase sigma factor (sigma-70 family)